MISREVWRALLVVLVKAGIAATIKIEIIAMTTNSSIKLKARRKFAVAGCCVVVFILVRKKRFRISSSITLSQMAQPSKYKTSRLNGLVKVWF